jgi:hypothetical protein
MAKKKRGARSEERGASTVDSARKATPLKELAWTLRREVDDIAYAAKFRNQREKVERLERELEIEREALEHAARPLRQIEKFLKSDELRRMANSGPHDAGLKTAISRLELSKREYDGKKNKYVTKPTGAKPWKELERDGATDKQIAVNLHSVKRDHNGTAKFKIRNERGETVALERKNATEYYSYTPVIVGMKPLTAAVRRVMQIGEPAKAAAKPAVKKKTATTTGTKGTKKKPAKKSAPKSAAKSAGKLTAGLAPRSAPRPAAKQKKADSIERKTKKPATRRTQKEISAGVAEQLGMGKKALSADDVWEALFNTGPSTTDELAERMKQPVVDVWTKLKFLQSNDRAALDDGRYRAIGPVATKGVETPATTNGKPASAVPPKLKDAVDIIRELGPSSAKTVALQLGLTTDAAGALLRRRVKSGQLKKTGGEHGGDVLFELAAAQKLDDVPLEEFIERGPAPIDDALDLSDDEPAGGGTAVATARVKKNRVFKNPVGQQPMFGGKPR